MPKVMSHRGHQEPEDRDLGEDRVALDAVQVESHFRQHVQPRSRLSNAFERSQKWPRAGLWRPCTSCRYDLSGRYEMDG